jgi:hypothetical protein
VSLTADQTNVPLGTWSMTTAPWDIDTRVVS